MANAVRYFLPVATLAALLLAAGQTADSAGEPAATQHPENTALYVEWGLDPARLPYPKAVNARQEIAAARSRARDGRRFVMIAFGANWCADCRALHRQLESPEVKDFATANFEVVNVDIGDFDRNLDVATEFGVDMQMGIPVAIFFDREGRLIGATNHGELEPARTYTSHQILKFLRAIVDDGRISAPN